jgi:hypothetical protein
MQLSEAKQYLAYEREFLEMAEYVRTAREINRAVASGRRRLSSKRENPLNGI